MRNLNIRVDQRLAQSRSIKLIKQKELIASNSTNYIDALKFIKKKTDKQ